MPKTASEIFNKKLYASDSVRAIEQRVNQTWMHTSVVDPNRSILMDLFEGFCGLVENDPNLIENGLEKLENFNKFLTEPQDDGRTGFDILTDGLSKADTETFFSDLRRFNRDLDWGLDMEKIEEIKNEKVASIVDEKISVRPTTFNDLLDNVRKSESNVSRTSSMRATTVENVIDKSEDMAKAPDLYNEKETAWALNLKNQAKAAKGKMNSSQYNKFYDEIKVFTNLAEKIIEAKENYKTNMPLSSFNSDTRKRLSKYAKNGIVENIDILRAYSKSWNQVKKKANDYQNYKLNEKHFTRDPKVKPGHTLDVSGKKKFALMDQIFGKTPREVQKVNNVQRAK
ncbi:hypothetical protein [Butyrivibrio sp. WCD3002]|uniref:hypothetical protein n=1 Tax=Butyrivibrio sp. WCD3002 TaxID=1280676 RepID=UPI0003FBDD9A|nr:hypothetical protein [Butyrivibrio sp. WCD3002]